MKKNKHLTRSLCYVDSNATYEVLLQFADKMALGNHEKFLNAMIYRQDHQHDHDGTIENLQPIFPGLWNIMLKRYPTEELMHDVINSEKTFRYLLRRTNLSYL